MINTKQRIAIITNVITNYRQGFYDRLLSRDDVYVKVYCQDKIPGTNLNSIHERYKERVTIVKFISARKEKIVWQFLPWRELINDFDLIFIPGNPRVLSDLLFATYLRIIKKKIVLWTMGHSYRGNKISEKIRLLWSRVFPFIFVYTDIEANYMFKHGFKNNYILGMNNGLDQKKIDRTILFWDDQKIAKWKDEYSLSRRTIILSSARLEPKNKFEQVIQALPLIINKIPDILWCLIGSGEEEEKLKLMIKFNNLSNHVALVGALYEEMALAPYFLSSCIFVHPASIGLSILHAYGYGLPVITHGNSEFHGPEYATFIPEVTGRNFTMNNVKSLADSIINLYYDVEARKIMKDNVKHIVREQYNVDVMVDRFISISNLALKN